MLFVDVEIPNQKLLLIDFVDSFYGGSTKVRYMESFHLLADIFWWVFADFNENRKRN